MQKVIIRDWIEEDLELYQYWNIGDFEWMKFNGPYYPKSTSQAIEAEIKSLKQQIRIGFEQPKRKLVIADETSNQLLGTVSWYWQSKETNWMSVGLAIYNEAYWGKGIGFDALSQWVDYLFENHNDIVRLDLRTWSGNNGMMRLAEKVGFKLEARFRKARVVNGKFYDSMGYGILREEWNLGKN